MMANKISFNISIPNSIHVCRSEALDARDLIKTTIQYGFMCSMTERQHFYAI